MKKVFNDFKNNPLAIVIFLIAILCFCSGVVIAGVASMLFILFWFAICLCPLVAQPKSNVLYEGKHLRFIDYKGWEYVERIDTNKVAVIIPVLVDENGRRFLVFIKEFRAPLQKYVIGFPAGLIGDHDAKETMYAGALRELEEETGYTGNLYPMTRGPSSAGLSNEIIDFYLAVGLEKVGEAVGDGTEKIEVIKVPVYEAYLWLDKKSYEPEHLVDSKTYLGLYFVCKYLGEVI